MHRFFTPREPFFHIYSYSYPYYYFIFFHIKSLIVIFQCKCKIQLLLIKNILIKFDPVLRNIPKNSQDKINAWIKDQYIHPIEHTHTFDEVLNWFEENNIEFVSSIPQCNPYEIIKEKPFLKQSKGEISDRIFSQILMIFNHFGSEGGLFIFAGMKK